MDIQARIDKETENYLLMLQHEHWTVEHALDVLRNDKLTLIKIAALATAICKFES